MSRCPRCGSKVHGHGTRPRQGKATKATGGVEKQQYQARRFVCSRCKKSFTRLPAMLLPYKQYVAAEIERVLHYFLDGGKFSELSSEVSEADAGTIRRWLKEFSQKLPQWVGSLEARMFNLSGKIPCFIRESHPLKRLEEALSQLPALPSQWPVMVKASWWLGNSHPLCLPGPP